METSRIQKRIHYIWFGRGKKNELIRKCQQKTVEILKGWQITEWTEDTYDVTSCAYMKEAYDQKKYAFASDYARFDLLYKYGGVYLDTDVELLKKIPDDFLKDVGFTGLESNCKVAPGLVFACEPGNPLIKEIIEDYQKDHFIDKDGRINTKTVVDRVTEIFCRHGFQKNGSEQNINGFCIYPVEYFSAYDFVTREFTITEKTISIHHYAASWINPRSKIKRTVQDFLRRFLGVECYKKIIKIKRKIFGVHGT